MKLKWPGLTYFNFDGFSINEGGRLWIPTIGAWWNRNDIVRFQWYFRIWKLRWSGYIRRKMDMNEVKDA